MSEEILQIPVKQIILAKWDVRTRPENESGLLALANSIRKDGFVNALTCVQDGEFYKIIAGRRRLKAAKILGLETVPVYVKSGVNSEADIKRITLIENAHREEIVEAERARGIAEVYESYGFTKEDACSAVKSIDNFCFNHGIDFDEFSRSPAKLEHSRQDPNPLVFDEAFLEAVKAMGFAPKYQYQLLTLVTKIERKVLDKAEAQGLSTDQKIMLTTGPLKDHPKIQSELIDEMKPLDKKVRPLSAEGVRTRVQQVASDLETGYIEKATDNSYTINSGAKRDKIPKGNPVLQPINARILNIHGVINKYFYHTSDRKISKNQREYTDDMINSQAAKDYRLAVVKSTSERGLVALEQSLQMVVMVTKDILRLIDQELESKEFKKKVSKK